MRKSTLYYVEACLSVVFLVAVVGLILWVLLNSFPAQGHPNCVSRGDIIELVEKESDKFPEYVFQGTFAKLFLGNITHTDPAIFINITDIVVWEHNTSEDERVIAILRDHCVISSVKFNAKDVLKAIGTPL